MAKKENRHAEHFDKLSASLVSASANIEAPYELPEGVVLRLRSATVRMLKRV